MAPAFCTLFDSNYAAKGIALYLSLERVMPEFTLYVMAMDRECGRILGEAGFGRMVVECLDDIEDPELAEARANRSRAEFCWTCGSYVTYYFFNRYRPESLTYLDSDLMFLSSPKTVLDELEGYSVGITDHFANNTLFGRYCVQYVYFKSDEAGAAVLGWWKGECLKWCFSKLEDGKYGDQKYLENFKDIAPGVHDIEARGAGLAYWNMFRYRFSRDGRSLSYRGVNYPVIFFHYSGVNVSLEDGLLSLKCNFHIPAAIRKHFLVPYAELLAEAYRTYLHQDVSKLSVRPQSRAKSVLYAIAYPLQGFALYRGAGNLYLRLKYRVRKSPYSERQYAQRKV